MLQAADEVNAPMQATARIFQPHRAFQAAGPGHEGNHALVKALERLAGIDVGGRQAKRG